MQTIAKKTMSVRFETRPTGAPDRCTCQLSFHEERIDGTSRLVYTVPLDGDAACRSLEWMINLAKTIVAERQAELATGFSAIESARIEARGNRCGSCRAVVEDGSDRCTNPKCDRVIRRRAAELRCTKCNAVIGRGAIGLSGKCSICRGRCPKCGVVLRKTATGWSCPCCPYVNDAKHADNAAAGVEASRKPEPFGCPRCGHDMRTNAAGVWKCPQCSHEPSGQVAGTKNTPGLAFLRNAAGVTEPADTKPEIPTCPDCGVKYPHRRCGKPADDVARSPLCSTCGEVLHGAGSKLICTECVAGAVQLKSDYLPYESAESCRARLDAGKTADRLIDVADDEAGNHAIAAATADDPKTDDANHGDETDAIRHA